MNIIQKGWEAIKKFHMELIHLYYKNLYRRHKLKTVFMGIGCLYLLRRFSQLACFTLPKLFFFIPKFKYNLQQRYGENSWAVVTGASDGLGKEFCIQLAQQKFNIVLIGRNMNKLDQVCKVLNGVQTKIIVADFSNQDTIQLYNEQIDKELKDLDVSILINNVGESLAGEFQKQNQPQLLSNIRINTVANIMMTKILNQKLQNRQNRSAIISISSGLAYLPCPYVSLYGSLKAYNHYFNQSLGLTGGNIDYLSVTPLGISTKMMDNKKGKDIIEVNECVHNIITDLRLGKKVSCGSENHQSIINWLLWRKEKVRRAARIQIGMQLKQLQENKNQ